MVLFKILIYMVYKVKKYRKSKKEAAMYKDENGTSPDGPRLSNLTGITGLTGMTKVYDTEAYIKRQRKRMQRLQQQARQPPTHSRLTVQYFSDGSADDSSDEYDQSESVYKNIQRKNDAFSEYSSRSHALKPPTHFENGQRKLSYMSGISAFDHGQGFTGPGPQFIDGLDPRQTMISNADSDMSYMTDARLTQMSRMSGISGISGLSGMSDEHDQRQSIISRPSVGPPGGRRRISRRYSHSDAHENHNNWKTYFRNYRTKRNSKVKFEGYDDKISEYTEPDSENVSHL